MLSTETLQTKTSWLDRPLLGSISIDREKALYALLIVTAIFTRLVDLNVRVMSHDETVHVQWSWYLFQGRGYAHTPLSHGPFLFHATALSYYLFGDTDFSARLAVALLGIVLVALPYLFRRWLGRTGALVTSFLFLISPSLLYYSRYIRHDIPVIVWSLVAVAAIFYYLEEARQPEAVEGRLLGSPRRYDRWLFILAGALSLMFATKEVAFIYVAIFGTFLALYFLARLGAPRWVEGGWERWSRILLWIALGGLLVSALATGLSGIFANPVPADVAGTEAATTTGVADYFALIARAATGVTLLMLAGYVGLLTLAASSHRWLIRAIIGLGGVIVVATLLFSVVLYTVDLFPIRYRDCGQVPTPGIAPGQMQCTESGCQLIQNRCQRPITVVAGDNVVEFDEAGTHIAIGLSRMEMWFVVVAIGVLSLMAAGGTYWVLDRWMKDYRDRWPVLDLILFIGSFILPFLSAFAISGFSKTYSRLFFGINAGFNSLDYSEAGLLRSAGFVFILLAVSVTVGLWWNRRRWLIGAAIFYTIFVVLYTTVFTNGTGLASGMVGSLGYWLEQQGVQRGSQPWYYYGLLVPLYEYLPLIGFLGAVVYLLWRGVKPRIDALGQRVSLEGAFITFVVLWTALTWVAYTVAGEKMPWLTTHFAVPMALATGWLVGKLLTGVDWRAVWRQRGWMLVPIAPVTFAALVQTTSPWLSTGNKPFAGYGLGQMNTTLQFLAALVILAICGAVIYLIRARIGGGAFGRVLAITVLAVLAVLTIRTAWLLAYVNYDYATEFLVYAHSTPDVREVMSQIEDISRRTAGDLSLDIGYTGDGSYPFIWYLRNYPNAVQLPNPPSRPDVDKSVILAGDDEWSGIEPYLGANYTCTRYNFLWWPMQDYYNLNWQRISYALTNPQMRAAVWDIIFRRDYTKYEAAVSSIEPSPRKVRPSEWPLRDSFRFCVRKDVAAQVWSEGAGPLELAAGAVEPPTTVPDFAGLELTTTPDLVISDLGANGNLNGPHDLAVDDQGFVYVADSNNHRIVKFSSDGQVVDTWDSTWWRGLQSWKPGCLDANDQPLATGDGEFCEPWGIATGPDGRVYVADTWNHRIQVFNSDGEFLGKVGAFGQSGGSVSSAPSLFYGPRDVTVDAQGLIYVTDTGNKRIQVFDANLGYLRAFGGPGIIEGRLEEPVGLALGPDGLLYVADTWNTRLQAFSQDGSFVRAWPIAGWDSQSVANKPYLGTDSAGNVYVTDPENGRVLVFSAEGTPLALLGGQGSPLFQLPTGVALDGNDRLWVSDASGQRLLRFPALTFNPPESPAEEP